MQRRTSWGFLHYIRQQINTAAVGNVPNCKLKTPKLGGKKNRTGLTFCIAGRQLGPGFLTPRMARAFWAGALISFVQGQVKQTEDRCSGSIRLSKVSAHVCSWWWETSPWRALGSSSVVLYYRGPESPDFGELWDCQHQLLFTSPCGESRHEEQPWMLFWMLPFPQ